jgi:hypothetical protein
VDVDFGFLRQPVVGSITLLQIVIFAVGLIAVFFLWRLLKSIVARETPNQYQARMKCRDCGWTGVVGKHIPTCRKCAGKNLRPV